MLIEKTEHFFRDAVDLMDVATGEMVTLPMSLYEELRERTYDDKIFFAVREMHRIKTKRIYLPGSRIWITV